MIRSLRLVLGGLALVVIGVLTGFVTATTQQEPNYLVIETFELPSDRAFNEAQEEMMEVVRAYRSSGAYKSVRLFTHSWGPEVGFYLIAEPDDWASIPAGFGAFLEGRPDFLDQSFGWSSHGDNILTEVPVD
ncbi:MAG TPA: hypothetical protein VK858_22020 [Longimicrobiales bacterium]|nr:hypothetical protein [Longimicrobiales bacterium]